jgi:hypothetical protein
MSVTARAMRDHAVLFPVTRISRNARAADSSWHAMENTIMTVKKTTG